MSTDRGRRRGKSKSQLKSPAQKARSGVRLAPGVRLDGDDEQGVIPVLISPSGKVQLNGSAVAILRLCDGSRTRDDIVAELTIQSHRQALAEDIIAFLEVARARGWIIDP